MPEIPKISIPRPCHQNWNEMTPVDQGRFCMSCNKVVTDFTKTSDEELVTAIRFSGALCGRFRFDQLHQEPLKHRSSVWKIAASGVVGLLGFTSNAVAQETPKISSILVEKISLDKTIVRGIVVADGKRIAETIEIINKSRNISTTSTTSGEFVIEASEGDMLEFRNDKYGIKTVELSDVGNLRIDVSKQTSLNRMYTITVIDQTGALPGANVQINNSPDAVQTDINGKVTIESKAGDHVRVSYVGMLDYNFTLDLNPNQNVVLDQGGMLGGMIIVGHRQPTFFGRLFRKIGRIFK